VDPEILQTALTFLGGVLAVGIPSLVAYRKQSQDAKIAAAAASAAITEQAQRTAVLVLEAQNAAKESLDASEARFRETILARLDKHTAEIDTLRTENVTLKISNASLIGELKVFQYENEQLKLKVTILEQELHARRA
jgi:hypothetical protein